MRGKQVSRQVRPLLRQTTRDGVECGVTKKRGVISTTVSRAILEQRIGAWPSGGQRILREQRKDISGQRRVRGTKEVYQTKETKRSLPNKGDKGTFYETKGTKEPPIQQRNCF